MRRSTTSLLLLALSSVLSLTAQQSAQQPTRISKHELNRLLEQADPTLASVPVMKSLMRYRNAGAVSCHTDDAKIAENHFAKTGSLTVADATMIVRAYLDCAREQGMGPAIEGIANPRGYVAAIDKRLQGPSVDDPISTMIAGIHDVEAALAAQDFIQALIDYEALTAGSAAVKYRRAHPVTGADVAVNTYTRQPVFSWTPAFWTNIQKGPDDLSPDDLPFVREYLNRTSTLAQDLRAAVEAQARLVVASSVAPADDPASIKQVCDSAEQISARISDAAIRSYISDGIASARASRRERETLLRKPATMKFDGAGSTSTFVFMIARPGTAQRESLSCGDTSSCLPLTVTGTMNLTQSAASSIRVRFRLQNAKAKSLPLLMDGKDFDFELELSELWPSRTGRTAADHTFSSALHINGTPIKLPDYAVSFTEKAPAPVSLSEVLKASAEREYALNVHLYSEEAGAIFKKMAAALSSATGSVSSIEEMIFDVKIKGTWKLVPDAPAASGSGSKTPQVLTVFKGLDKKRAESIARELLAKSLPAFVITLRDGQSDFFEVRVGPFAGEAEVATAAEHIRAAGFDLVD